MNISDEDLERLEELGYDPRWLETGVLDLELLRVQSAEFRAPGGDRSTEHYGIAALRLHLDHVGNPTDPQLDAMLEVARRHPQPHVYSDLLHRLAERHSLAEHHFELIARRLEDAGLSRVANRHRLLRLLRVDRSSATVLRCIDEGDRYVHLALLRGDFLDLAQLERLSVSGANMAIRNEAVAKARRRA